jgi:zinc protease
VPAVERRSGGAARIEHPATQSHIMIGTAGIAWGDPDQFPLLVGNYVLGGGGFVSRLYSEVREKRGLAYSVYSYFSPMLQPGPFTIGLQTQKAQTDPRWRWCARRWRFLRDGPTEAELARGQVQPGRRVSAAHRLEPQDPRQPRQHRLTACRWTTSSAGPIGSRQVTVAQIRAAFARHLRADSLVTVVVGDAAQPAR